MLGLGNTMHMSSASGDKYNYSVVLDGDDYLTVSDDDSLSFGDGSADTSMSISFWMKVDDLSGTAYQGILVKGEEYSLHIAPQYDRLLFRRVDNDANGYIRVISTTNSILEGVWQHVLITSDDSELQGGLNIYIDGSSSILTSAADSYTASENDSTDLFIGRATDTVSGSIGTTYRYLTGSIANMAFWDAELTAANAKTINSGGINFDIANSGIATDENLQVLWKFEEQTGTTVADSSSNSNTATFAGDPTWAKE